jgi:hypothetical protein
MRNTDVARAWARGEAARTAHLWTDGDVLLSYRLRIGYTDSQGYKVALVYRAGTPLGSVSQTTSRHVGLALRYSDARSS